ncbi:MAG: DMT family transporter [Rhodospirillales bacterium]|nr:DMT family transporter [Rhodospirillales bacterium]
MTAGSSGGAWRRAFVLVTLAVLMLTVLDATVKYLVRIYPLPMVSWARYFFHLATFGAWILATHRAVAVRTRRLPLQIVRGLLLVAMTFLFIAALGRLPLADATAINFLSPIVVTALSALVLRETVGWHRWLAVIVGFAGVLIIVRPDADVVNWGALLALGATFFFALYQIATRALAPTDPAVTTMFYTALVGTAATSLIVPFFWAMPTAADFGLMVVAGVMGGGGHFLLIHAYRHAEASLVAPLFYVQIVFATGFGYVAFGETPDVWTLAGAALIILGGLWIWSRERRAPRP